MLMRNMLIFIVALMSAGMADQISGKVSSVEDNTVTIAGVKVDVSNATVYNKKGEVDKASNIKKGTGLEVVGTFDASGKVVAKEVTIQKKIKTAIIEGTVEEVNGVVKYIIVSGVKIQAADGGKITNDLGHTLAIEMIEPGAHIMCEGEWRDAKRFYAQLIMQNTSAANAEPEAVQLPAEAPVEEVVEDPAM